MLIYFISGCPFFSSRKGMIQLIIWPLSSWCFYILYYLFGHSLFLVDLLISWSLYIDLLITCLLLIRWSAIHYCFVKQLFMINSLISCLLLFYWSAVVRGARSASQQSRGAETSPLSAEGGLWPDPGETDRPWLHATGTSNTLFNKLAFCI